MVKKLVKKLSSKKLMLVEQAKLLKILGELLQKGYPLIQAIEFLTIQIPNNIKESFENAKLLLLEGNTFIEFAKKIGFHQDVIVYLYYAEKHGDLSFALREGSFMLYKKIQHRSYLRKVMGYPICLLLFLVMILFIFRNLIIPQYEMLFSSFQMNRQSFTFVYLQVIKYIPTFLIQSMLVFTVTIIGYYFFLKKLKPIEQMDRLIRIPLLKKYLVTMNTYEISMQLSILLHAGFPIIDALSTMQNNDSRTFIKEKSKFFYEQILNGVSLQELLRNESAFYQDLIFIIDHGMNNSSLEKELSDYADYLKQMLEEYFQRSIKLIQPIIFIVISSSILSIYIAILFPMFQIMNNF